MHAISYTNSTHASIPCPVWRAAQRAPHAFAAMSGGLRKEPPMPSLQCLEGCAKSPVPVRLLILQHAGLVGSVNGLAIVGEHIWAAATNDGVPLLLPLPLPLHLTLYSQCQL